MATSQELNLGHIVERRVQSPLWATLAIAGYNNCINIIASIAASSPEKSYSLPLVLNRIPLVYHQSYSGLDDGQSCL